MSVDRDGAEVMNRRDLAENMAAGKLDFDRLLLAIKRDAAALRFVVALEPAEGMGGKVFPPTYEGGAYHRETRLYRGREVDCVVIDSPQSCANRIEEALDDAAEDRRLAMPRTLIDFAGTAVADLGRISDARLPHRIFDATLRHCNDAKGMLWPETKLARLLASATPRNATALYRHAPLVLLLGGWDSHGERGAMGGRYARQLCAEIVAYDARVGRRTGGKLDRIFPAGVELTAEDVAGTAAQARSAGKQRARSRPKSVAADAGEKPKAWKLSELGLGSVTPDFARHDKTKAELPGGVTAEAYRLQASITLAGLRRMSFPLDGESTPPGAGSMRETHAVARTVLAALGLAGLALQYEAGYALRSRCWLVPTATPIVEILMPGKPAVPVELDVESALEMLHNAAKAAKAVKLAWEEKPVLLKPTERLIDLIQRSRLAAGVAKPGDAEGD